MFAIKIRCQGPASISRGDMTDMTKYKLCDVFCFICFILAIPVFAQNGGPLQTGPLIVTVPPGWTVRTTSSSTQVYSPESTLADYFSAEFFPPQQTTLSARERH